MATKIKKRTDGRYRKTFSYNGKRYSVYSSTPKDLDLKIQEKLKELQEVQSLKDNPTFDEYYDIFTEFRRGTVKEATICTQRKWYNGVADLELSGTKFRNKRIRDITEEDMLMIQHILVKNNKVCHGTINDWLNHISHVFNFAIKKKVITSNPCSVLEKLKYSTKKTNETIHRSLTSDESKQFLELAQDSFFINVFKLMMMTGLRIGEVGALQFSDFDLNSGFLTVNKTVTRTEAGAYVVGSTPKTDCGNRKIPLNAQTKELYSNQLALIRSVFGFKYNRFLFPSAEGNMLLEYMANREIKRLIANSSIEHFTSHALRDTFATRFVEQNPELKNVKVLQKLMGHSDIKVTMDIYVHVLEGMKTDALENFQIVC